MRALSDVLPRQRASRLRGSVDDAPDEAIPKDHPQLTVYAESQDGMSWTKPSLGLFEFEGSKQNNILWMGEGAHNFAPFKDTNPDAPPSERYKALAGGPLLALKSADGIHWERMQEEPVISDGKFDSQTLLSGMRFANTMSPSTATFDTE